MFFYYINYGTNNKLFLSSFVCSKSRRRFRKQKTSIGYRYICKVCDNKQVLARRKAGGWKNEKKRQGPGSKHSVASKINSRKHRTEMSPMYVRSLMTKKSKSLNPNSQSWNSKSQRLNRKSEGLNPNV